MTMNKYTFFILLLISFVPILQSCSENPSGIDEEQELITEVVIHFRDTTNSANDTMMIYHDPDGDAGPITPTITGASLKAGVNYQCSIELYDRSKTPPDTVTNEIRKEASKHRFDYIVSGIPQGMVSIAVTDTDSNGLPVGLVFRTSVSADASGAGALRVLLNHFHTQTKRLTNNDETDIDITFPLVIE